VILTLQTLSYNEVPVRSLQKDTVCLFASFWQKINFYIRQSSMIQCRQTVATVSNSFVSCFTIALSDTDCWYVFIL